MKHVFLFNEETRAGTYGIGTYINELTNILSKNSDISFHIVFITSTVSEFTITYCDPVIRYDIPLKTQSEYNYRYYRNLFYLLYPVIEAIHIEDTNSSVIFHFNYYQHRPLMELLKLHFSNSKIYFTIHQFDWYYYTKGSRSYFKDIINEKSNVSTTSEKYVWNDFVFTKKVFEISDKVICLSNYTKKMLIDDYSISETKIVRISNFIKGIPPVLSLNERNDIKKKLYINLNEYIILFVGRLDFVKGIDVAIRSFKTLIESNKVNARLFIVGDGDFAKYYGLCEGIWSKVTFTGKLEKKSLSLLYQIADIGIMPSLHEQCSYVAIEMLSHGIPLIAATSTGLTEMIPIGLDKYKLDLAENEREPIISIEQCATNIFKILNLSDLEKSELKNISRNQFINTYELSKVQESVIELYMQ